MDDFELGAYDLELYYAEDYEGWLAVRRNQLKLHPYDYQTKCRLAEALVLTKKYTEALVYLKTLHDEEPEDEDYNQLIFDCLRELGKNKGDFQWKVVPESLGLNKEMELEIREHMKAKRKKKLKLIDVHISLLMSHRLEFDEKGLLAYLKASENFNVEGKAFYDAIVERS